MGQRWPLVGRDQELHVVETAVLSSGLVVAGPAGVGKSRLVGEVMRAVEANGRPFASCTATESSATVPFGALMHLLLPAGARPAIDVTTLFSIACDQISTSLDGGVLLIDDAHLLDEPSAATVHQVARAGNVALLVVIRTPHTAPAAINALWKDEVLPRLDLQTLSRPETQRLIEADCGGPISEPSLARLHAVTSGNPLFIRELMVEARVTGALEDRDGVWWWSGVVTGTPRLTTIVEHASRRLSTEATRVLELLALIEPLPATVIERVLSPDALTAASADHLIDIDANQEVRLSHPLYGEVARAAIDPAARSRIVQAMSTAIMSGESASEVLATQLAVLHLSSGVPAPRGLLANTAAYAALTGDPVLGQRLARAALTSDPSSFHARFALGRSLALTAHYAEAERELEPLVGQEPDDAGRAAVAYTRMGVLYFDAGAEAGASRSIVQAARDRVTDHGSRAMLDAVHAEIALNEADLETAGAITARLLEDQSIGADARLLAAHVRSMAETFSGRAERGAAIAADHWQLAKENAAANPAARGWMLLDRFLGMSYSGSFKQAFAFCETLVADPDASAPAFEGSAYFFHGRLHLLAGRPATAERWLRQAIGSLRSHDPRAYLHWALGSLGAACALRGDLNSAVKAFDESNTGGAIAGRRLFDTDRQLSSCWLLAAQGQMTAAAKKAEAIGTAAADRGMVAFATLALHEAVRLGSRTAITPLVIAAEGCETRLAAAMSAHASARRDQDPDLLLDAMTTFRELGWDVLAAEAAITAAEAYRNEGRKTSARSADAMADAILAECEGIRTPIIDSRTVATAKLTARESEVVRRAAQGVSNRDIAAELFTSVRTVEGHLLRAFTKLGISKRSELRAVLEVPRPQP